MSAKPLKTCPKCRRRSLQRLIGPGSGVIFKGSGFYQTDYKKTPTSPAKPEKAERPKDTKPRSEK